MTEQGLNLAVSLLLPQDQRLCRASKQKWSSVHVCVTPFSAESLEPYTLGLRQTRVASLT